MDALHALNRLESGCTLLVSLPGSYLSTTFEMTPKGCKRYNTEMGTICTPMSKGEIFKHFSEMLKEGGEIVEI